MGRKKASIEKGVVTLEEEAPLLDDVIENTPKQEREPKVPKGFKLLPVGAWYVRVNQKFMKGEQKHPMEVYQSKFEDYRDDENKGRIGSIEGHGEEIDLHKVQDLRVYGVTEMVVNDAEACGAKRSVRMRVPPESRIAVKT